LNSWYKIEYKLQNSTHNESRANHTIVIANYTVITTVYKIAIYRL